MQWYRCGLQYSYLLASLFGQNLLYILLNAIFGEVDFGCVVNVKHRTMCESNILPINFSSFKVYRNSSIQHATTSLIREMGSIYEGVFGLKLR